MFSHYLVRGFVLLASACAFLVGCSPPVRERRPWGTADFSSPKALLTTYLDAAAAADPVTLRACIHATTPAARRHRDNLVDATVGIRRMSLVLHRHFPDAVKADPYLAFGSDVMLASTRKNELAKPIKISGDRATIGDSPSPTDPPLRCIAGRWMWDFDAWRDPAAEEYANHALRCRAAMPLLDDVEAGRITTYEQFASAWSRAIERSKAATKSR